MYYRGCLCFTLSSVLSIRKRECKSCRRFDELCVYFISGNILIFANTYFFYGNDIRQNYKKINKIVQLNSYFYHVLSRFVNYCSVCYELC